MSSSQLKDSGKEEAKVKYEERLKSKLKEDLLYIITSKIVGVRGDMDHMDMAIEGYLGIDRRKVTLAAIEEILVSLKYPID